MVVSVQLSDELREILKELGEATGAMAAWIAPTGDGEAVRELGGGMSLYLGVDAGKPGSEGDDGDDGGVPGELATEAALEHAARALRAAGRRWSIDALPRVNWALDDRPSRERVLERIESYLQALANADRCDNMLLVRDSVLVASASPPTELQRERIAFAVRQVAAAAARREGTSHGEIVGDDLYVRSFYIGAVLIGFFSGPWATDFVRHRARRVTGDLAHLLGMLDVPPPSDVATAPVPVPE
jgi:hypothetical protein